MKPDADQPKAPEPKPSASAESKPDATDTKTDAKPTHLHPSRARSLMPSPMRRTI